MTELIYPATAVLNGQHRVPVSLVYDPSDPWAVTFAVGERLWLFARDLLASGVYEPSGHGDVQIRPDTGGAFDAVLVTLSSPSGTAELALPRGTVEALLDAADAVVPAGCEEIDWDTEWSRLTEGPAAA
ncbi:SsgA family sporulation/cell division regulator [Amycolatopsis sp. WAC 01376]|uniref:SsgA family sporulation/cell division regulator n=1 Tax=Amycolatopsis sp. WAC 01376 TaxID=2203195 RepID=UPI000F7A7C14|nr:SsgA family sporulation/cell division regulator [Amycolatopsis sp. WAC 01376]RSM58960.1 SsgA family sporulation/cell division regulator [Amycolatopsis sp. WAC 01376]